VAEQEHDAGLVAKALDEAGVASGLAGQELEGHADVHQDIVGQVNNAHAAIAYLLDNAIPGANDRTRLQLLGLDQHGAVSGAGTMLVRKMFLTNRTGLHSSPSPAKTVEWRCNSKSRRLQP
jgi:hypothetical protein